VTPLLQRAAQVHVQAALLGKHPFGLLERDTGGQHGLQLLGEGGPVGCALCCTRAMLATSARAWPNAKSSGLSASTVVPNNPTDETHDRQG